VQGFLCRSLRADRPGTLTLHDVVIADRDTDHKAVVPGDFISTVKKHDCPVLSELKRVFEGTPFMPTAVHRVL